MPRPGPGLKLQELLKEVDNRFQQRVKARIDSPVSKEDASVITNMEVADDEMGRALELQRIANAPRNPNGAPTPVNGQVGTAQLINISKTLANQTIPSALIQAQASQPDGLVWNVTLMAQQLPIGSAAASAFVPYELKAVVDYSNGGTQETVLIDWINGLTFQVPGTFVRVTPKIIVPVGANGNDLQVLVGAFLDRGVKTRTSKLIYTSFPPSLNILAGNHSSLIPVPSHAVEVFPVWTPTAGANPVAKVEISVYATDATTLLYDQEWDKNEDPLPVVSGAGFVQVLNNEAANAMANGRLCWTIEI